MKTQIIINAFNNLLNDISALTKNRSLITDREVNDFFAECRLLIIDAYEDSTAVADELNKLQIETSIGTGEARLERLAGFINQAIIKSLQSKASFEVLQELDLENRLIEARTEATKLRSDKNQLEREYNTLRGDIGTLELQLRSSEAGIKKLEYDQLAKDSQIEDLRKQVKHYQSSSSAWTKDKQVSILRGWNFLQLGLILTATNARIWYIRPYPLPVLGIIEALIIALMIYTFYQTIATHVVNIGGLLIGAASLILAYLALQQTGLI